jgi:SAM-dependent methyltransferase
MELISTKELVSQRTPWNALRRFLRLGGKRILEIGGNSSCVAALPFIESGAQSVVVSGLDDIDSYSRAPRGITIETADALHIGKLYGGSSFDCVYGVSVLEHIPEPDLLLENVAAVLVPGGFAFLQGGPLWSGALGHHIWLDDYRDQTSSSYHFIPYPGSRAFNPIPDWGHLLMNEACLADILKQDARVSANDINKITDFIFHRQGIINRVTQGEWLAALNRTTLALCELEYDRINVPDDTLEKLQNQLGLDCDWSVLSMRFVLKKS